ncbi:hypothetical protein SCHPADRAFT_887845 [Schizopora paradoxa]|uniref:P-loop containing nucleoside triphosphate hydrolase protein n=1 Tax=Schizopora paradoxa TaxID=27342 RepID=A0A0H2RWZ6_9AGAM|nr:hypothetical protein SCHPADRAFT_887845 [Schizopora paradoxa]
MPAPLKLVTSWRLSLPFSYSPLPSPEASKHDTCPPTPKSPISPFPNGRSLTLAVVGASGCGKTTFIKRSLKRRGLTSSDSKLVEWQNGHMSRFLHYVDRNAYINIVLSGQTGMSQMFYNATILEVNISELINPNDEKPCDNGWPSCLPAVDGIFVCYDASDRSTFANVVDILSGLTQLKIPTMVLALKSDLEQHITPKEACISTYKYSGLVELTDQTEKGREKMRRSVGAFIKLIEDGKRQATAPEGYRNPALPKFSMASPQRTRYESTTSARSGRERNFGDHEDDDDDRPIDLRGLAFVDQDPPSYSVAVAAVS